jgi:Methyltransferase domain
MNLMVKPDDPADARLAPETVLVFPGGLPDSLTFCTQARARGCTVVGASSLAFDPATAAYDHWAFLPYVHKADFAEALAEVIGRHGATAVYSPHEVVSGVLAEILGKAAPGVRLIQANPLMKAEAGYRDLLARAAVSRATSWFTSESARPRLSDIERAGVVRLVDTVPGMTDLDKIGALIEVMRHAPDGDIVEIGSWWGRSAALLTLLAHRWKIGAVLCVDPWRAENLDQGVDVLDRASARMDVDEALRIFQINLSPLAGGRLNYLRATSTAAAEIYRPGLAAETETFGQTIYSGEIALLHIDGNHAHAAVAVDSAAWTPHVRPGGWIVFDDYVWAFGDGPKQVGDAFLIENAQRIDASFVIGTALFIQLAA